MCESSYSLHRVPLTQDSVQDQYFQHTMANHLTAYPVGEMLHSQPACVCDMWYEWGPQVPDWRPFHTRLQ